MPVAGGAVRQEVEEDADDDLPNAGMDTPVKVRKFPNIMNIKHMYVY